MPVPECIAHRQHIRLLEISEEVAIGMAGAGIRELYGLSFERKRHFPVDDDGRACSFWNRMKGPVPIIDVGRFREVLESVPLSDDLRSRRVHPLVAVRMIPVP